MEELLNACACDDGHHRLTVVTNRSSETSAPHQYALPFSKLTSWLNKNGNSMNNHALVIDYDVGQLVGSDGATFALLRRIIARTLKKKQDAFVFLGHNVTPCMGLPAGGTRGMDRKLAGIYIDKHLERDVRPSWCSPDEWKHRGKVYRNMKKLI